MTNKVIEMLHADPYSQSVDQAVRAIPPVWPLASSVAVNPFLGQTDQSLAQTGALLARVAGVPVTMERAWYAKKIADGTINNADIKAAIALAPPSMRPKSITALKAAAEKPAPTPKPIPTVANLAGDAMGVNWTALISERFGAWASGYFDAGQALWAAPRGRGAYEAWRAFATHDLTPEIAGLKNFARHVVDAPETASGAIARASKTLGLTQEAQPTYFHALLMTLGGWAQVARYKLWEAELTGGTDSTLSDLLAIRLVFEEALFTLAGDAIATPWEEAKTAHAEPVTPSPDDVVNAVLQEAADRAAQRAVAQTLAGDVPVAGDTRPAVTAAFCIDVRSEVFRRALESVTPKVRTLGFAGFFGIASAHKAFASDVTEKRLPVLLTPAVTSRDAAPEEADDARRFALRASRAWGRFKLAAVSSFAFVEAAAPLYVGKLLRDALGLARKADGLNPPPVLAPALPLEDRIEAAATVLSAMSLTDNFGRIVLLAGHGANVTNNPHASALHCGACGGYAGDVNARLLAALLNDRDVRAGLADRGIHVPADTWFLGALHDTTTDLMTLFEADAPSGSHAKNLETLKGWLAEAGALARAERALRLPRASSEEDISHRSADWAETRPEWALAGCQAFIAAPRARTAGKSLGGRAFLHDYDHTADEGYGVLELIMTAPVVVASWISLQYYGSTVAPQVFGSGNKLLHNVTGGIGVVEGNGGLLRAGLPIQSVHDGETYIHDPLRLAVMIEAPTEAMTDILRKHEGVRALFDNRWLHLIALDANGQPASRYQAGLKWQPFTPPSRARAA